MHKNKLLFLLFISFTQNSLFGMKKNLEEAKNAAQLLEISDQYLALISQSTLLSSPPLPMQIVRNAAFQPHPAIAQLLNSIRMPTFIDRRYAHLCMQTRQIVSVISTEIPEVAGHWGFVFQLMAKEWARDGANFSIKAIQEIIKVGKQPMYWIYRRELPKRLVYTYVQPTTPCLRVKNTSPEICKEIDKVKRNQMSSSGLNLLVINQES